MINAEEIIKLKAEIFDLQIEHANIKMKIQQKLNALNELSKNGGKSDGRTGVT